LYGVRHRQSLIDVDLIDVDLIDVDLTDVNLTAADLTDVNLTDANSDPARPIHFDACAERSATAEASLLAGPRRSAGRNFRRPRSIETTTPSSSASVTRGSVAGMLSPRVINPEPGWAPALTISTTRCATSRP
jgi:hypothetical protein